MALRWNRTARTKQVTPDGDWRTWLLLAGRGYGKSLAGANDLADYACFNPGLPYAVIAPTARDLRLVCFEGPSGLLSILPPEVLRDGSIDKAYNKSLAELCLANGSKIQGFTGEEPERLRGPQFARAWVDELCAFARPRDTWDMLQLGLRLGDDPRVVVTTTPKPITLLMEIWRDERTIVTRGSTYENKENLADSFFDAIAKYEGTQLGRQELHAEILDPEESGIVKRSWFKLWPANKPLPQFHYVVLSYDTAFSEKTTADYTACTMWGVWREDGYKREKNTNPFNALLFDCWHERLAYPDLRVRVEEDWKREYGQGILPQHVMNPAIPSKFEIQRRGQRPALVLIEEKGSGISLLQDLARANIIARGYNPGHADKTLRLHLISDLIKSGFVWLPESESRPGEPKSWCSEMLTQVCTYAGRGSVEHDDYCDSLSQALSLLRDQTWLKHEPKKDRDEASVFPPAKTGNPYAA